MERKVRVVFFFDSFKTNHQCISAFFIVSVWHLIKRLDPKLVYDKYPYTLWWCMTSGSTSRYFKVKQTGS